MPSDNCQLRVLLLIGVYPKVGDVKTLWVDLLLWAVLANEREIARHCWVKTTEPMRYAIWAAHVAHATSLEQVILLEIA